MPNLLTLQLEQRLGAAHRYLWDASKLAESHSDQGWADDLREIVWEIERMQEDLLRGRRRSRPIPT